MFTRSMVSEEQCSDADLLELGWVPSLNQGFARADRGRMGRMSLGGIFLADLSPRVSETMRSWYSGVLDDMWGLRYEPTVILGLG